MNAKDHFRNIEGIVLPSENRCGGRPLTTALIPAIKGKCRWFQRGETKLKAITIVTILLSTMTCNDLAGAQSKKATESHRRGICGEIEKNVDALLYENPRGHGATTTCSYTDERLLIKPNSALTGERMKSFVFLTFVAVGALRNDDFMLPDKVYVGYGLACQVLTINAAAKLQRAAKYGGDLGFFNAMTTASDAPKVPCPK